MPDPTTSYIISPSNDSTVAIEISKTGLRRSKKHMLFFDQFSGELCFAGSDPEAFRLTLTIAAGSVECRDAWLSERKRQAVAAYVRLEALAAGAHEQIHFTSTLIRAKALRGFVVEGMLHIRDRARMIRVNAVLGSARKDCFQIDGDTTLRLSDFGLPRPSSLFGLVGTKDEVLVRLLLWATPAR